VGRIGWDVGTEPLIELTYGKCTGISTVGQKYFFYYSLKITGVERCIKFIYPGVLKIDLTENMRWLKEMTYKDLKELATAQKRRFVGLT
jgi:hypothetical protein